MPFLFAVFLAVIAFFLLARARRTQQEAGLPVGKVIYADPATWGKPEKPFYDPVNALTGKPDFLVEQNGVIIPVEVKSGWAPEEPYTGHVFQLMAYCLLVENSTGKRPPYGILKYRDRTFSVDYTPEWQSKLIDLLVQMRKDEKRGDVDCNHEDPGRCARCGFRKICDQRLT